MNEKMNIHSFLRLLCKKYKEDMPIIIFGAGMRGVQVLSYLTNAGRAVMCFYDNNPSKHFCMVEGTMCYPKGYYKNLQDSALIFISPYDSAELYQEFVTEYSFVLPSDVIDFMGFIPHFQGYTDFVPIGHYSSLYPNLNLIMKKLKARSTTGKSLKNIDLNEEGQKCLVKKLAEYYHEVPEWAKMEDEVQSKYRYRYGNLSLSEGDAVGLYCMLRYLKPKRMIEVGSGYTSAIELDTNEFYFDNSMDLTFIEPYPDNLLSILSKKDDIRLLQSGLEDIPISEFQKLKRGDVLFIDSTHVSKRGSDVNYLFFELIPQLNEGVYIHLHDIFYPFEYPDEWIIEGMVWNELYLLRAFLQNNYDFEIVFFQNMMEQKYPELFLEKWPIEPKDIHGGSFWMRKLGE